MSIADPSMKDMRVHDHLRKRYADHRWLIMKNKSVNMSGRKDSGTHLA
jgi:hypothetical protein